MTMEGLLHVSPDFPVYIHANLTRLKAKALAPLTLFKYFGTSYLFERYKSQQELILGEHKKKIPFAMVYRGESVPIGLVLSNIEVTPDENRTIILTKHRKITYCLTDFDSFVADLPPWGDA